jgi:hypothetical protein
MTYEPVRKWKIRKWNRNPTLVGIDAGSRLDQRSSGMFQEEKSSPSSENLNQQGGEPMPLGHNEDLKFTDCYFLRDIKAALDHWEKGNGGSKPPDELLMDYLGAIKWGGHPGWPSKDFVREIRSILYNMEDSTIVKSVAVNYEMSDRDAFWLCLGLVMGGKAVIDMLNDGVERIDHAISKK